VINISRPVPATALIPVKASIAAITAAKVAACEVAKVTWDIATPLTFKSIVFPVTKSASKVKEAFDLNIFLTSTPGVIPLTTALPNSIACSAFLVLILLSYKVATWPFWPTSR